MSRNNVGRMVDRGPIHTAIRTAFPHSTDTDIAEILGSSGICWNSLKDPRTNKIRLSAADRILTYLGRHLSEFYDPDTLLWGGLRDIDGRLVPCENVITALRLNAPESRLERATVWAVAAFQGAPGPELAVSELAEPDGVERTRQRVMADARRVRPGGEHSGHPRVVAALRRLEQLGVDVSGFSKPV